MSKKDRKVQVKRRKGKKGLKRWTKEGMSKGRKREKAWKIWTKDAWSREGWEGKEGLKEEKNQYDKEGVSYDILMALPPTI